MITNPAASGAEVIINSTAGGAEVFNTNAPVTWTDLDLTSVTGVRDALVLLCAFASGGTLGYHVRANGDTNDSSSAVSMFGIADVDQTAQPRYLLVLAKQGIIEHVHESGATTVTVKVIGIIA